MSEPHENARAIWDSATATTGSWAVFRIPEHFRSSNRMRTAYKQAIDDAINTIIADEAPNADIRFTTKIDATSDTLWARATVED